MLLASSRTRPHPYKFTFSYTEEGQEPPQSSAASAASTADDDSRHYYIDQIHGMKDFELSTLYVDFTHLLLREEVLAKAIAQQYYR